MRFVPYSEKEKEMIISEYASPLFSLKRLAGLMGRPKANISRYARQLGLTNRNRPKPYLEKLKTLKPKQRTIPGFQSAGLWQTNIHPKGMLGKTHSPEYRKAISERMKAQWADPNSILNSELFKLNRSDSMTFRRANNPPTNPYSRAKRGRRSDLGGKFFKSRWEANFARYLNFLKASGNILSWEYEPIRFDFEKIKRGTRSYLPDFAVMDKVDSEPYFYEVKGWMDKKSATRLKRMGLYHPKVRLIIIGAKEYKEIEIKLGKVIPNWEMKNDVTEFK